MIRLLACLSLVLSGCNITRGVGEDMAAVGRTLTKVSGTEDRSQHEETSPASQPFDQSYEDQAYVEPAELPQ
jgi:predicted small secreted protein